MTIIEPGAGVSPQVVAGTTFAFAAKVSNSNGSPISWGVQPGDTCTANNGLSSLGTPGGTMTVGTVPTSSTDKMVISYSAPATPPAGSAVTLTALQSPSTTGPCVVVYVVATRNGLFNFTFAFEFGGFSTAAGLPFSMIGRFLADGNGNIANGFEDVNVAQADGSSVAYTKVAFTGSYSMDSSSHGTLTLTVTNPPWSGASPPANPPPTTMHFAFTMSADGSFGELVETDGAAGYAGSGYYQFQAGSAKFSTQYVVGSYLFGLSGAAGPRASAVQKGLFGRLDLSASTATTGAIANSSLGDDQSGAAPATPLTGGYVIDDQTNGHGVLNISGGASPTVSFYIATPGILFALRTDGNQPSSSPDGILAGVVRFMPKTAFDNSSLQSALFALQGISGGHASAAVGLFASGAKVGSTTDGFLQGLVDLNDGGTVPANSPLSFAGPNGPNIASFTVAPSGRGTISIALGAVTYNFVFYMRNNGIAFVLEQPASDGSNRGRSGRFFPQVVMTTAGGPYIGATSVTTAGSENADAVLALTTASNTGTFQNSPSDSSLLGSAAQSSSISGTFTLTDATNNRGTLAMTAGRMAGSATAVFYVASDTEVIVLGNDASNPEPQLIVFDQ
ncbi:MAG TPA: hypothetical protein VEU54_11675 [Steroidobacteraceae bacterium]|nr:hypothetical protein [Steroidobacteraceae bacterium]